MASARMLPVRNPRTGQPDPEIEVADRAAVAAKAAKLRGEDRMQRRYAWELHDTGMHAKRSLNSVSGQAHVTTNDCMQ